LRHGGETLRCFDCSGLVCYCLRMVGGPDWSASHTADRMWKELPPTPTPRPGDLAFYGQPEQATHVMLWTGDDRVYGACGGNSSTRTIALAQARGARVMFKLRVDYRYSRSTGKSDLLGFRVLSPLDE
jgi:cell wall-associated NlpC family hydrolase